MASPFEVSSVSPTSMNSATDSSNMTDEALMEIQAMSGGSSGVFPGNRETETAPTAAEVEVTPACEYTGNFQHNFPQIDVLRLEITKNSETLAGIIDSCNNLLNSAKQEKSGKWTIDCRDEQLRKTEETFSSAEDELKHLMVLMDELKTCIGQEDTEAMQLDDSRRLMRDALRNAITEWEVYLEKEIQEAEAYYDGLIKERAAKDEELSDWAAATSSFMLNLPGSREQRLQEIERILTEMDKKEQTLKWIQEVDLILQAEQISTRGDDDRLAPSSSLVQAWNELQRLALDIKHDLQDDDRPDHNQRESSASVKIVLPSSREPESKDTPSRPKVQQDGSSGGNCTRHGCHICLKTFTTHQSVQSHIRTQHFGERPFKSKTFTSHANLQSHRPIHTGEKRYRCPTCHKAFSHSGTLNFHLLIHSNEKPFKCPMCLKGFEQPMSLYGHIRIHVGEKAVVQSSNATRNSLRHPI